MGNWQNLSNKHNRGTYMTPRLKTTGALIWEDSAQVATRMGRLIDFAVTLNPAASSDRYIILLDASNLTDADQLVRAPFLVPPKKISAGETVDWNCYTEWLPFDSGLCVYLSTASDNITLVIEDRSVASIFARVSYESDCENDRP